MTLTATTPLSGDYTVDTLHSSFGFAVRYMGVSTYKGTFSDVEATVKADGDIILKGSAEVGSISITEPQAFRDHVLAEDFFDYDNYQRIGFTSENVRLNEDGSAVVIGVLTIKDHSETVEATGTWTGDTAHAFGGTRAALNLQTTVDRTAFGLTWNAPLPGGGKALSDEVVISVDLVLAKEEA